MSQIRTGLNFRDTMDVVVRSAIAESGYVTLHKYIWYLHWAMKGMKPWNRRGFTNLQNGLFEVMPNKSINFPAGAIGIGTVGIKTGDRILPLVPDSSISKIKTQQSANKSYVADFSNSYYRSVFEASFPDGQRYYGYNHNRYGYYDVDFDNRQINFSSDLRGNNVYLSWMTHGYKATTETLVPDAIQDVLIAYIKWREAIMKFGANSGEAAARKLDWEDSRFEALATYSNLTVEGLVDARRKAYSLNVKAF